ncbi:hypothetical protein D3C78_1410910 [compost metagenome]
MTLAAPRIGDAIWQQRMGVWIVILRRLQQPIGFLHYPALFIPGGAFYQAIRPEYKGLSVAVALILPTRGGSIGISGRDQPAQLIPLALAQVAQRRAVTGRETGFIPQHLMLVAGTVGITADTTMLVQLPHCLAAILVGGGA